MSGLDFYAVKLMAIITVTLVYFAVLAAGSFALSKIFPSDDNESIEKTAGMFMLQIAGFVTLFYVVRTQLKKVPDIFNGVADFNSSQLKERDGQIISGLALLMFSDSFLSRGLKIKKWIETQYTK